MNPLESVLIAVSMLVLFVVTTQTVASLLGRDVPMKGLDAFAVQPYHRRGIIRLVGIIVNAVTAVVTQGLIAFGIVGPGLGDLARTVLVLELIGAILWAIRLVVLAAGPARNTDLP